jgi:hypothetical protein
MPSRSKDWQLTAARAIALLTLALVILRESIGARTVLITRLPIALDLAFHAFGLVIGGIMVFVIVNRKRATTVSPMKVIFIAVTGPCLLSFCYAYLGRWGFEIAAFANVHAESHITELRITDVLIKSRSAGYRANAMASPKAREIEIFVTQELHARLIAAQPRLWTRAYSEQEFCISLPIEQGRWGATRAHVPALWDKGVSVFRKCAVR